MKCDKCGRKFPTGKIVLCPICEGLKNKIKEEILNDLKNTFENKILGCTACEFEKMHEQGSMLFGFEFKPLKLQHSCGKRGNKDGEG